MPETHSEPRFGGVHTIMPTPFTPEGALDEPSLARLTAFLAGLGLNGVVVLGVMGEAPKLSESEQAAVIVTTVRAAGTLPVFAGSGAAGTRLAVEKSLKAMELGAAGLLIAPPPVQADGVIFEYYRQLDAALAGSEAPLILHDYPAATGVRLSVELVTRLHGELGRVKAIKLEDPPTGPKISALRKANPRLGILGGLGGMYFLQELERGADGLMTGFSYPEALTAIYRAFMGGDLEAAARTFYAISPLLSFEFQPGVGLALRKEVYRRRGAIASAHVRHPGAQIDATLQRELSNLLDRPDIQAALGQTRAGVTA